MRLALFHQRFQYSTLSKAPVGYRLFRLVLGAAAIFLLGLLTGSEASQPEPMSSDDSPATESRAIDAVVAEPTADSAKSDWGDDQSLESPGMAAVQDDSTSPASPAPSAPQPDGTVEGTATAAGDKPSDTEKTPLVVGDLKKAKLEPLAVADELPAELPRDAASTKAGPLAPLPKPSQPPVATPPIAADTPPATEIIPPPAADPAIADPAIADPASKEANKIEKSFGATALADLQNRPISSITTDIRTTGEKPPMVSLRKGAATPGLSYVMIERDWTRLAYCWEASALCHKPLYFEETNLERYGYSCRGGRLLQPAISTGHFFATVPLLPYKLVAEPCCECVYTLGEYRPGSPVPYRRVYPPLSPLGGTAEASAWVLLILAIP